MSIVADVIAQESPIMGGRYISAVALSCLVYDHLLRLNDELADIWLNFGKQPILKSLFLLGRYSAIIAVVYTSISHGIFNTEMTAQGSVWVVVTVTFMGLSLIGTEGIVIYRLRSLWRFNRPINRAIVIMAVVVFTSAIASMGIEAFQLKDLFRPLLQLPGCMFISPSSGPLPATLVVGLDFVIWDTFNLCIFTFNTFATPYLCSSDVLDRFKRDGGRYFLYLLVLHLLFLFASAFGQSSRLSTLPLMISLTAIINARIFHGIALEAEKYADEYDITLPKATS